MEDSIISFASLFAMISLIEDSVGDVESRKLDFFNQPAAVVLSVCDRKQSLTQTLLLMMSTQIEMTEARNSKVLIWARPMHSGGILNLQALPA